MNRSYQVVIMLMLWLIITHRLWNKVLFWIALWHALAEMTISVKFSQWERTQRNINTGHNCFNITLGNWKSWGIWNTINKLLYIETKVLIGSMLYWEWNPYALNLHLEFSLEYNHSFIPVMSAGKNAFGSVMKVKNSKFNSWMQRPKYSARNVLISWLLMPWRLAGECRLIYILSKMFRVSTVHIEFIYWSLHSENIYWTIHCTFALYSCVPSVLWV